MTLEKAIPVAKDTGLLEIRDLVEQSEWPEVTPGTVSEDDSARPAYIDWVCEGADGAADGMKIVVDAGNGMCGMLLPEVFERLGGEVTKLYWEPDGSFPHHEANPLIDENNADAQAAVRKQEADLGVMFDADGDRLFFTNERGETVPADIINALLATEMLKDTPGGKVLYDLRSSHALPEAIREVGGTPVGTRVGHSYIKAAMREEGAFFAGEVSGHVFFTPWYAESALKAMVVLLKILKESGAPLSELTDPLINLYATSDELNYEVEDKEGAMARIEKEYGDGATINRLDGITLEHDDWWTNVRPSGTEPLLRLKVEADTTALLDRRVKELEGLIGGKRARS